MVTTSQVRPSPIGAMRAKDAAAFLGIGISTWWRWCGEGRAPKGIKLGPRVTVWRKTDIESILAQAEGGQQ